MKYKVEHELELVTDLLTFADDPLSFVLYAYPWGKEGTPLEHIKGPRTWQVRALIKIRDHIRQQRFNLDNGLPLKILKMAKVSGRGPGKSAFHGWIAHWMVSCHLGASVVVTANTEAQLRSKSFPEFGRWVGMSMNAHWFYIDSLKISPQDWIANMVRDQLKIDPGYWYIAGANWSEENPDAFAGTHNSYGLAILYDEASGIPAAIWKVTEGFFTEMNPYRLWVAFSNGRRNAGPFFDRFHKPEYRDSWDLESIDARTVEGTDQSVYESIIREHGADSDTARVEVYGQFPEASEDQFISNSLARGAQYRKIESFDDSEPLIMGVDPAPRGRTAIRFRQGRDARSIHPTILNGADNNEITNAIVRLIEKYDPDGIVIDGGNGTGVIDNLKRRKIRCFEVWFGAAAEDHRAGKDNSPGEKFATLGTELWAKMRNWLAGGCVDSPDPSRFRNEGDDPAVRLFNDLTARTWHWHGREDGVKILDSKRDMAEDGIPSPDDGDALALTFYPKLPRRRKRTSRNFGQENGGPVAIGVGECSLG